jgi:uncharacterized cupredoxin-like copper-binding protein
MTFQLMHQLVFPAVVAVAIAALAFVPLGSAHADKSASATTIEVKGGEFFFRLASKTLEKPGRVKFVFKNVGYVPHDFSIGGTKTPLIQPGKTTTLAITFKKKGKFAYLCTVPGHAQAGMKGVFTVR